MTVLPIWVDLFVIATVVVSNYYIYIFIFSSANGQWNHWGHWSGCSKSCDGGWEKRIRICQGAATTGQQCEGSGDEVRRCSEQRCPGK